MSTIQRENTFNVNAVNELIIEPLTPIRNNYSENTSLRGVNSAYMVSAGVRKFSDLFMLLLLHFI